jgi:hypothetical protein
MICVRSDQLSTCPITDLALFNTLADLHEFLSDNPNGEYQLADDPRLHNED